MGLDIRWPIGLMFTLIGLMLVISGAVSKAEDYQRSLGININLYWGLLLLVFGGWMLTMAIKGGRKAAEEIRKRAENRQGPSGA
jgi:intracellular septation protein A